MQRRQILKIYKKDASEFAKNTDSANLKTDVDKLDV